MSVNGPQRLMPSKPGLLWNGPGSCSSTSSFLISPGSTPSMFRPRVTSASTSWPVVFGWLAFAGGHAVRAAAAEPAPARAASCRGRGSVKSVQQPRLALRRPSGAVPGPRATRNCVGRERIGIAPVAVRDECAGPRAGGPGRGADR